MSAHTARLEELCVGDAVGWLDDNERTLLAGHVAEGCATCDGLLARYRGAVWRMVDELPPSAPRPELRDRVLEQALLAPLGGLAERTGLTQRETVTVTTMPWWGWSALYLAAALAVVSWIQWQGRVAAEARLAEANALAARVSRNAADLSRWDAVSMATGGRVAQLRPVTGWDAVGRVTYDPRTQRALVVLSGLDASAPGDYVLWAVGGGGRARLGPIHPDGQGRAVSRVERAGRPETLAGFEVSLVRPGEQDGRVVLRGNFGP